MTPKRLKKLLKTNYMALSTQTKTPIGFFRELPLGELSEWVEIVDDHIQLLNKKLGR